MVATSGAGWRLAPCLIKLVEETDALFPQRSIASDGSIGDTSHQARPSDHNPSYPRPPGYVDAVDLTDDDAHGCDISRLFGHLIRVRDRRVKYLIHKGRMWRSYNKPGLPAWTPEPYTGSNAHVLHGHISILDGMRNDISSWWPRATPPPPPKPKRKVPKMAALIVRQSNSKQALFECGDTLYVAHNGAVTTEGPIFRVNDDVWNDLIATHPLKD